MRLHSFKYHLNMKFNSFNRMQNKSSHEFEILGNFLYLWNTITSQLRCMCNYNIWVWKRIQTYEFKNESAYLWNKIWMRIETLPFFKTTLQFSKFLFQVEKSKELKIVNNGHEYALPWFLERITYEFIILSEFWIRVQKL